MQHGNVFSRKCLCVCVYVCNALSFDSLSLERLFLVCVYSFIICRSSSYISRSSGQGQGHKIVYPVWALNFECLDLKPLVSRYIFEYLDQVLYQGYREGHRSKMSSLCLHVCCVRV